jgi:hypothetical protein
MPAMEAWGGSASGRWQREGQGEDTTVPLLMKRGGGGGGGAAGAAHHSINNDGGGELVDVTSRGIGSRAHNGNNSVSSGSIEANGDEPLLELGVEASEGTRQHAHAHAEHTDRHSHHSEREATNTSNVVVESGSGSRPGALRRWRRVLAWAVVLDVSVTIACEVAPNPFEHRGDGDDTRWWRSSLVAGGPAENVFESGQGFAR